MTDKMIPEEILGFFNNPGGHSLILKGLAGTGKTTFALQLIEELGATETCYYLSTRVSDESLYHQFKWLRAALKRNESIKIGGVYSKPPHADKMLEESDLTVKGPGEKAKVERGELKKLEGRIEMGAEGGYDKPGAIEDGTITFDLGSDLPEMDQIYDTVESWMPKRSLVVLDSVDALSERYGVDPSRLMNTMQHDLVENSTTNILYILETSEDTRMDYLGDGVIKLCTMEHDGRRVRMMRIEKLRGSEIRHPKYMFTLEGGRLMAFGYRSPEKLKDLKKWEFVPDISEELVSTGNESLDALIGGGLRKGSIVALEVGDNVPYQYTDMIKTGILSNFASQRRGVVTVPSMKATFEIVKDALVPLIGEDVFEENVRIFESTPKVFEVSSIGDIESSKNSLQMEGADPETELKWKNIEYNMSKAKKPFLSLMGFDTLESVYGPDIIEHLTEHMTSIRKGSHVFVGFLTPTTRSTQKLSSMSHVHVKIENINGTVVIFAQKPYTELYVLSFDYSLGFPKAKLVPMV